MTRNTSLENRASGGLVGTHLLQRRSSIQQLILAFLLIVAPITVFTLTYVFLIPRAVSTSGADLGDLKGLSATVSDVQILIDNSDNAAASQRITDLETSWDNAEDTMRPLNEEAWTKIDMAIDTALDEIRTPKPKLTAVNKALANLVAVLANPYSQNGAEAAQGGMKMVAGIAVTDAAGYPLPCEVMLHTLTAAMENGGIPQANFAEADNLRSKAIERCNVDDDRPADAFAAHALSLATAQ